MGCPTKRTEANRSTILRALKLGATYRLAAEAAGMHRDTLNEWMHDDPDFSDAVKKAEATRAQAALRAIERAAKQEGTWQAAAWYLERRYPHEYGRTVQEQHGEIQHSVTVHYVNDWRAASFQLDEPTIVDARSAQMGDTDGEDRDNS